MEQPVRVAVFLGRGNQSGTGVRNQPMQITCPVIAPSTLLAKARPTLAEDTGA